MKIYLCPGIRSHVSSFVGTGSDQKIACMFLRDSEDTVLITKDPEFVLSIEEKINLKLNNHRLKPVGWDYGLKVRIRVASTTRPNRVPF